MFFVIGSLWLISIFELYSVAGEFVETGSRYISE